MEAKLERKKTKRETKRKMEAEAKSLRKLGMLAS